jgi:hypothetical protein
MTPTLDGCEELRMGCRVETDLDDEILQKILPRLHGSRDKATAAFPRSFAKVQRMSREVIEEQFVSFIY